MTCCSLGGLVGRRWIRFRFRAACRIEYAVLVDRGLRELPIAADYTGRKIDATLAERVFVRLLPQDQGGRGLGGKALGFRLVRALAGRITILS